MKQIRESQRHFLLLFPPHFSCLSCVKLSKHLPIQTTTIRHCSARGEKAKVLRLLRHLCLPPTWKSADRFTAKRRQWCRQVSASLRTAGSTEVRLVERWWIIHTLIETAFIIHELLNVKAISPPHRHDEKILNNRSRLQTSAFQWRRLTLKRLKWELLSYRESLLWCCKLLVAASGAGVFVLSLSARGWRFQAFPMVLWCPLGRRRVYCFNQAHKRG